MKLRTALLTGVSAVAALGGSTALAQQTAAPTQANQVEEIVVTATKRETNLQNTPIAISAFSQKTLDEQKVKDVTDLARFVPSLAFSQHGDQGSINLTMRGIGNDAAFTEVADPEVAIYIDGIYSPRAQGASVLMYDMDRVEVDRGPQGTLYGRNATVGAINLITAKPTFDGDHGNIEVVGGSYNRFGVKGMLNAPVSDTLSFRLAFITDRHDGYANFQQPPNVPGIVRSAFVTEGKKYYAQDQRSGRFSALWKPNDRFTWNLNVEGYQDTGAPVIDLMQTPRPGQPMWSTLSDTAPQTNRYTFGVRSQMDYALTDKIGVSYIAGAQRTGGSANNDSDAGALPPTGADTPANAFQEDHTVSSQYDAYSHEIQLKSTGKNTVDWILGGYFSHETNKIRFDIDQRNGYRLGTFGWAGSFIQADREIESKAVFGQAVWHLNDRIRLTGGLRYTDDTKKDVGGRNVTFAGCPVGVDPALCQTGIFGAYPGVTAQQLVALLPGYGISDNDVKGDWTKLTYLVRADADITDRVLAYASVGTGFKSGNIEDGGRLAGPESLTNYEVGTKTKLFDGRATLNVAAYYEDFTGYQVNSTLTTRDAQGNITATQLITQNAKGATAYGLEAELNARVTSHDSFQASVSLLHTELEELESIDGRLYNQSDPTKIQELKGNQLPHAPLFSGTFTYEHNFDMPNGGQVTPRFTTHIESRSWLSIFNQGAFDQQKSYTRSDIAVRYDPPGRVWSLEAFVLNVEDNNIRVTADSFGAPNTPVFMSILQPPRTWGVRASAKF